MPHAATGQEIDTETVSIQISQEGDYYLCGEKIDSYADLKDRLRKKREDNPEVQVVISADKKVYHEEVIRVVDAIRKLEIYKFAINVEPLEEEGGI